jgi:hypothetical protein
MSKKLFSITAHTISYLRIVMAAFSRINSLSVRDKWGKVEGMIELLEEEK